MFEQRVGGFDTGFENNLLRVKEDNRAVKQTMYRYWFVKGFVSTDEQFPTVFE